MAKQLFLVAGKPGCGKSTTANIVVQQLGTVYHFSMGDELRARAFHDKPSKLREALQAETDALKQNKPVPAELAAGVFVESVQTSPYDIIIVDGYPQYADQVAGFADLLQQTGAEVKAICLIDIPDELARQRLEQRPQRSPDITEDAAYINRRLANFQTNAQPAIDALAKRYPLHIINGSHEQAERAIELATIIKQYQ